MPRRAGFTLIEILVVLALLVGIAGVAMVSLTDYRHESQWHAAADRIEAVSAAARADALKGGLPVELFVRAPAGTSRAIRIGTRTLLPPKDNESDETTQNARLRTALPEWASLAADPTTDADAPPADADDTRLAVFLPDGSALGAADLTLHDARSDAVIEVRFDALTGACSAKIIEHPTETEPPAEDIP